MFLETLYGGTLMLDPESQSIASFPGPLSISHHFLRVTLIAERSREGLGTRLHKVGIAGMYAVTYYAVRMRILKVESR